MLTPAQTLGGRIRRARQAQGLSLDDVVARLDRCVTKAALSKYELGKSMPGPTMLRKLGRILGVPSSHFLGHPDQDVAQVSWVVHQRHLRLAKRRQQRIQAFAEQRAEAFLGLLRLLHPAERPRFPSPRPVGSLEEAESAALLLRKEWGLGSGPIERLVEHVEDSGTLIVGGPQAERFDAISGRTESGFLVIVLDLSRPSNRLRLDLAHELGHLLLDRAGSRPKEEEVLAQRFAAAFLVPAEAARHELGRRRAHITREELEHLERKYGFSVQAWIRRARDVGIITETAYRQWQLVFRAQALNVQETATYAVEEEPRRFRLLCLQALAERLVDSAWVGRHCPELVGHLAETKASRIQQLLRLPLEQRQAILEANAEHAAEDYGRDPEVREWLDFDDAMDEAGKDPP